MRIENARQEIRNALSFFSKSFSRPSFKFFSCFIISFIQLGKEVHTSSMVRSLVHHSILRRSLCSFTRFLGENSWSVQEVTETALHRFFQTLRITVRDVLFLIMDDTLAKKTGKKIPGCGWHKDHAQNMANVFGHQWVLSALLCKDFLLPLWAKLYHPEGTRGCGPFQTKITLAQKIIRCLALPPCKLYVLADSWYWAKTLVRVCRNCGYHMISQLKSNSVLWIHGKKTNVTSLLDFVSSFREISLFVYGKTKTLRVAKFMGDIKGVGKVAVVVVKEKRKKPIYLVCTNIHLPAIDIIKYYAKRWKIEQMIKDLKQRLGFGDYQVRDLQAIQRYVALVLLSYFVLILLKILQWLKDKNTSLDLSIRQLAFQVRKNILLENITVTFEMMQIRFKQNILDTYLEQLWA
jgi:hypothetical protein